MELQWKKGRSDKTIVSERMIWETKCKKYRTIESKIVFGDLPVQYYAMVNQRDFWEIISRHKKKSRAQEACEKHAKNNRRD